jgi:hypothetical protein
MAYLFQLGYQGPTLAYLPYPELSEVFFPSSMTLEVGSTLAQVGGPKGPLVIEGEPGKVGMIWNGPGTIVPAGSYTARFYLRGWFSSSPQNESPPPPSTPVLSLGSNGLGTPSSPPTVVSWGQLSSGGWTNVTMQLSFAYPALGVGLPGYQLDPNVVPELGYVAITPNTS